MPNKDACFLIFFLPDEPTKKGEAVFLSEDGIDLNDLESLHILNWSYEDWSDNECETLLYLDS